MEGRRPLALQLGLRGAWLLPRGLVGACAFGALGLIAYATTGESVLTYVALTPFCLSIFTIFAGFVAMWIAVVADSFGGDYDSEWERTFSPRIFLRLLAQLAHPSRKLWTH